MGLLKKRVTIEECGLLLATLCGQSVHSVYNGFSTPLPWDQPADPEKLYIELWILARFAVDYGVTIELGQANPKRNAVLDICTFLIVDYIEKEKNFPGFLEQQNAGLNAYAVALSKVGGLELAAGLKNVSNTFAKRLGLNRGYGLEEAGGGYFGKILSETIDIVRAVKIR